MVVYIDLQMLLMMINYIFDFLLLWATATATHLPAPRHRLVLGALVGTIYYVAISLASWRIIPGYGVLHSPFVIAGWPLIMLTATFCPLRIFPRAVGLFYLMSVVSAGSGSVAANLLGSPAEPNELAGTVVSCVILLLLAELGWGAVRQQLCHRPLFIPLDITFDTGVAHVTALFDTGNSLHDPLSARAVVVVECTALTDVLPDAVLQAPEAVAAGQFATLSHRLAAVGFAQRFHIIPYTSVGATNSLLAGVRPLHAEAWLDGHAYPIGECVVGLCAHRLDANGQYQALVGPEVMAACRSSGAAKPLPMEVRCSAGAVRSAPMEVRCSSSAVRPVPMEVRCSSDDPIYMKGDPSYAATHS